MADDIIRRDIEDYAARHTTPAPVHLANVAAETKTLGDRAGMLTGHLEGRFLKMLVGMLEPRCVLEIGCFTGYSALCMAEALPPGGKVITCELDPEHAEIARAHFAASPFQRRIELREGPALETIRQLEGPFDFVFIDADKGNYQRYYEAVLPLLGRNGVIAVDNTLWSGSVLDDDDQSEDRSAIVAFNEFVASDDRVECVMLTIRDGVTLIRRKDSD